MTNTEFYTAKGQLTQYGFACGYVEKTNINGKWKKMYNEHGNYHVLNGKNGEMWSTWETFNSDQLTKARKFYNSITL